MIVIVIVVGGLLLAFWLGMLGVYIREGMFDAGLFDSLVAAFVLMVALLIFAAATVGIAAAVGVLDFQQAAEVVR